MHRWRWEEDKADRPRKGRWSQAELALLRDWFGVRDERSIARELHRTPESVRRMAESALFRSAEHTGPWTSQEVGLLKRYLGATTTEVIARLLGRANDEIQQQVIELGRLQHSGRWSREEILEFKRLYGSRSDESLALIFGRSLEVVQRLAEKLCLAKDKAYMRKHNGRGATRMPRWSDAELDLLRRLYPTEPNLEIARQLNRSVKSVVSKAHHLDLKKDVERLRQMGRENVALRYQPS